MSTVKKLFLALSDVLLLYAALALTLFIRYPRELFVQRFLEHVAPFSAVFVVWFLVFYLADLYRQKSFRTQSVIASGVLAATLIAAISAVILFYLFGTFFELTPKTNLLIFATVFLLFSYFWRTFLGVLIRSGRTPVVVLGNSPRIEETAGYLEDNPHAGYRFAGWIKEITPDTLRGVPALLEKTNARTIVIQLKLAKEPHVVHLLYTLLPFEAALVGFSDFYEIVFERVPLDELEEGWFIERIVTRRPFYDAAKRLLDFVLGIAIGIVFLIPALLIALIVKITSSGPILFSQERFGKNGSSFSLYKFRTMRVQEDGTEWLLWTTEHDSRITPFGKFLRFAHLDELPQLWNIVRGDISFTGPRPERSELASKYRELPYYDIRHVVKPGLTGWAQINYKPSASLEEAREKLEYDIYYVKNRSFVLDLLIILRTIRYVFLTHEK